MPRIIALTTQKGGTGKSFLSYEMSYILSSELYNKRVLLINTDSQVDIEKYIGFDADDRKDMYSLYDIFSNNCSISDAVYKTNHGFDMIISDKRLIKADRNYTDADDYYIISDMVECLTEYDYIIIDTNRSRGFISTAIYYCADYVLLPTLNDDGGIDAIIDANEDINILKRRNLSHTKILGVVLNRYANTTEHKETDELLDFIAQNLDCKKFSHIRNAIIVDRAKKNRSPVTKYKKYADASVDIRRFVKEVVEEIDKLEGVRYE